MIHNRIARSSLSHSICSLTLLLLTAMLGTGMARAQKIIFSPDERKVIELQDHRAGADSIAPYLHSKDEQVAWRAAVALGNVGDVFARADLIERIRDEVRPRVRDAIGFALGMLGPDSTLPVLTTELISAAQEHPSKTMYEAIGRVTPKSQLAVTVKFLSTGLEKHPTTASFASDALMRLALRRIYSDESLALTDQLAMSDDPEARWRAAFVFARTDDSARLSKRLNGLTQLLHDQGSIYSRMFAASALGRIHDPAAKALLLRTVRSEQDWRVRTMAIQAMLRLGQLDSAMLAVLEPVVEASVNTDKASEHIALAALDVIEQGIVKGKVHSSADSLSLREWLHGFSARYEKYPEMPILVRSATMPSMSRLGSSDLYDELGDFNGSKDPFVRVNGTRAVQILEDTTIFRELLETMSRVGTFDQFIRLEALDSLWNRAKQHPAFMRALERAHFTNIYRYLIIRIADIILDPAVQLTAMQQMEDSTIIVDSTFRQEAFVFLTKYLRHFQEARYHDQLLAAIDLAKWMREPRPEITTELKNIYDRSVHEGWVDVGDSTRLAMASLGMPTASLPKVHPKFAPIDWGLLEYSPDTLLINTEHGQVYARLLKEDAPLSCLNMINLSKIGYFARSVYHRVVPAFVVQSGDPTTTGWGGPGYMIRSEVSPQDYDEPGIAGMASSGKDTEGSQWFITHVPTPHLDGRYTIWGKVVRGMNLIDDTQLGDKIENIVLLKH